MWRRLTVVACSIPDNALLGKYAVDAAGYTDCYRIDVAQRVSHADFVSAFYTSWLFRLERTILSILVSKPSTDEQARQLADGAITEFAAWRVEERAERELLMCDYRGRTRSWFMSVASSSSLDPKTSLFFGSAVVAVTDRKTQRRHLGLVVVLLLSFHKLYSRALLIAAKSRLAASRKSPA